MASHRFHRASVTQTAYFSAIPFQGKITVQIRSREISPCLVDIVIFFATHQSQSQNLGAPAWCSQSRMKHFEGLGAIRGSTWWARPAPRILDRWVPAWSPAEASLPAAPTSAGGTVADCCCSQQKASTNGVAFDSPPEDKVDMVLTSAAETYKNKSKKKVEWKILLLSQINFLIFIFFLATIGPILTDI